MRHRGMFARVVCCFVALCLFVGPASATMNAVMDKMFNSMINVTPGGIYQSQSAGIIAGPSIYERNKISTLRPFNFQAPRLKVGCEGIDAYAGSFSFINKEALINMMRNIASNALPYAFKMAISTLCPKCDNLMSELQKMADTMNKFNINSCKVASGFMGIKADLSSQATEIGNTFSSIIGSGDGVASDASEMQTNPTLSSLAQLWNAEPAVAKEENEYNSAWKSIAKSNIARWYIGTMADGDAMKFNRMVMSYTGTIVTRYVDDDTATEKTTETVPIGQTLYFDDFLRGGSDKDVYHCDDESDGLDAMVCLFPDDVAFESVTLPSIRDNVNQMLFGIAGAPGILAKVSQRASAGGVALTVDEQKFVEAAPGAIYAMLKQLSSNPQSMKVYATSIADWLAVEMTAQLLMDIVRNVKLGIAKDVGGPKGGKDPGREKFVEHMNYMEDTVRAELKSATDRLGGLERALQTATLIRKNLNEVTTASARPSLASPTK